MNMSSIASPPVPVTSEFVITDAHFVEGGVLPELRLRYTTLGTLRRDGAGRATNAVLLLHGTGGSGLAFLRPQFADVLFGPGQLLDASRYFLIMPDGIGHGGSSKPSDGLRAAFPRYTYADMVNAQHALLTQGLGVDRLRLVLGTSMGGMQTWMWGYLHAEMVEALLPLARLSSAPTGCSPTTCGSTSPIPTAPARAIGSATSTKCSARSPPASARAPTSAGLPSACL